MRPTPTTVEKLAQLMMLPDRDTIQVRARIRELACLDRERFGRQRYLDALRDVEQETRRRGHREALRTLRKEQTP